MLTFNKTSAAQADSFSQQISESGKYIGVITRAEKLVSKSGAVGLGLSFKDDSGATANYLDLYILNAAQEELPSMKHAQAIMGCIGLREAKDGKIKCEKYNKDKKAQEEVVVDGYPDMMGKRIGLLLQKEISEYDGKTQNRLGIFGVFQADTGLTITEILGKKTKPELLSKLEERLALAPVRDTRKNLSSKPKQESNSGFSVTEDEDSDLPF